MPLEGRAENLGNRFDIIVVFDPRSGDTGARHSAAAISALAESGNRIGVLHWLGQIGADAGGVDPLAAELFDHPNVSKLAIGATASCLAHIAFDMRLFIQPAVFPIRVNANQRFIIVTRRFADRGNVAKRILENAREALSGDFRLVPAAPSIRSMLETILPDAAILQETWAPVFSPAETPDIGAHNNSYSARPSIGYFRHSRHRRWPEDFETFRKWFPKHHLLAYRLYHAPGAWTDALRDTYAPLSLYGHGRPGIEAFLSGCDFLVTTASPEDDPYPEEIIRALDFGVIPLLQSNWQKNFIYGAAYAPLSRMAETAIEIYSDRSRRTDIQNAWRELRQIHFSPTEFARKVRKAIGPEFSRPLVSSRMARPPRCVINLTTNGIGMGHLTRQLAIARKLPQNLKSVFVSFSHAADVVRQFGFAVEFQPFHTHAKMNSTYWNLAMHAYLESVVRFYDPSAFILDANIPFTAIDDLREKHPELPFLWVRRGMWGEGRDLPALQKSAMFDAIIEPGEIADLYDTGPTSAAVEKRVRVPPIVLLNENEALPRHKAAHELGLDPNATNVLFLPGAQNNFDASAVWRKLIGELGCIQGLNVVFADWLMSDQKSQLPAFVRRIKGYPYHRWFAAFDFAVSAGGYNSFAELMSARVPTIFVPNENPTMDRQDLRALFAERRGMGLCIRKGEEHKTLNAVKTMCDPARRHAFRKNMGLLQKTDGAARAADIVAILAEAGRTSSEIIR